MSELKEEKETNNRIGQGQFYNLITGNDVSWQAIIYDLIKPEQLDPWDIDLGILAENYTLVVEKMEEANFYVSSKVLFACCLLLRLKSEILSNQYLKEIDEAIYGKELDKKYILERINIDEDDLPILVPKTPIPRYKKVTLAELMSALHNAIETENRRIRKDIKQRQAEKSALVVMPRSDRIPLKDRVSGIFEKIKNHIKKPERVHMTFSELAPSREEKLSCFLPVLHLANTDRVYLKQPKQFEEVFMRLEQIQEEIEEIKKELGEAEAELDESKEEILEEELGELEEFEKGIEQSVIEKKLKAIDKELEENSGEDEI